MPTDQRPPPLAGPMLEPGPVISLSLCVSLALFLSLSFLFLKYIVSLTKNSSQSFAKCLIRSESFKVWKESCFD